MTLHLCLTEVHKSTKLPLFEVYERTDNEYLVINNCRVQQTIQTSYLVTRANISCTHAINFVTIVNVFTKMTKFTLPSTSENRCLKTQFILKIHVHNLLGKNKIAVSGIT